MDFFVMPRMSVYRVRYQISGWIEIEAQSDDDALDAVSDMTVQTMLDCTTGQSTVDIDEVEMIP
jgi:hypothetical protein